MAQFVSQDSIAAASARLVARAQRSIDVSSGWIKGSALRLLLETVRPRLEAGELAIRIVYRLKEMSDLDITELGELKEFEDLGANVRYCRRLHAKMVIVDGQRAIISSSNLTATAGYTHRPAEQDWTNYEAGVLVEETDSELVVDAQQLFERIWEDSESLGEDVAGAVIGQPTTTDFQFVVLGDVRRTQYVIADSLSGYVLGKVEDITTLNVSFPELSEPASHQNSAGFNRRPLPDLRSLFAGESKERALLLTTTFYDPAAAFSMATVRVLKQQLGGQLRMPLTPTAPGALVRIASDELLSGLQGNGEIGIGYLLNHEAVTVRLRADELLQKHCAVYGMTGAGKSNGLKVLLRQLVPWAIENANGASPLHSDSTTRIIVIDTHGEYASIGRAIHDTARSFQVVVPDRVNILDEVALKEELHLRSVDAGLKETLWNYVSRLEERGEPSECGKVISYLRKMGPAPGSGSDKLCRAYERDPDRFTCGEWIPRVVFDGPDAEEGASSTEADLLSDLSEPGLYILNLRGVHDARLRSLAVSWVMDEAFEAAKNSDGLFRTLFVVDEVQNFAPESGIDEVRASLDAILRIAREGRKFGVGLIVSSQRPASVSTSVRSQCNSHLIFRLVNANDLAAIADTVDAAERRLVDTLLPQLDTGTCLACGTAIESPFFAVVPLFRTTEQGGNEPEQDSFATGTGMLVKGPTSARQKIRLQ